MIEAAVQLFSVTLEGIFSRPQPFAKDKIDQTAEWLTDSERGFALRSDQVRYRQTDVVFGYELSASFYGGNATFRHDAEKIFLTARGAKTQQDAGLIRETATRFARFTSSTYSLPLMFSANAHAALSSGEAREQFLSRFRLDPRVSGPCALGYLEMDGWPDLVRICIEPSFGALGHLFFIWQTNMGAWEDWQSAFDKLVGVLEKATEVYGIRFQPLE